MGYESPAIRVTGLHKTFRIPKHRVNTLKERALHPFRTDRFDSFHVLRGIDFEVDEGEFFGIVGRNGSGKSTLLKCLAGIYRIDSGQMLVAGRLSPFIELGVGFNPELTARDNIVINAVMMGLTTREAKRRLDEIVGFAELERFVDQKLKNFSSGMQVRLAFSVMVQSDPEVMLIDEVLAVGDAAFQQKCIDVFHGLKSEGKTIVLVTHDMGMVQRFCDRAIMISDGLISDEGDPTTVGRAYLSENFRTTEHDAATQAQGPETVRVLDANLTDNSGCRIDTVAYGDSYSINVAVETTALIRSPALTIWVTNEDGVRIYSVGAREDGEGLSDLQPGERLDFTFQTTNTLAAGRYRVGCSVTQGSAGLDVLVYRDLITDFVSYGGGIYGVVGVPGHTVLHRSASHGALV